MWNRNVGLSSGANILLNIMLMEWVRKVWWIHKSVWMFIISNFASNTEVETFTPLVDGVMDKAVLYTIPHLNQMALHIVQILNFCLLNSMLNNAPDLCSTSLRTGHIFAEIYFQNNDSSILYFWINVIFATWRLHMVVQQHREVWWDV